MRAAWWGLAFIALMAILLRLLLAFIPGIRVTSWWRSPWRNLAVGGRWFSMHLIGWGGDVIPVNAETGRKLRRLFPFVLDEGDHYHVGWVA